MGLVKTKKRHKISRFSACFLRFTSVLVSILKILFFCKIIIFTCFLILTTNKPLVKPYAHSFKKVNIFITSCLMLGKYTLLLHYFIVKWLNYYFSYPQRCFPILQLKLFVRPDRGCRRMPFAPTIELSPQLQTLGVCALADPEGLQFSPNNQLQISNYRIFLPIIQQPPNHRAIVPSNFFAARHANRLFAALAGY